MMFKFNLIFISLFCVFIPFSLAELSVSIEVDDSFSLDEMLFFDFEIISSEHLEVVFYPRIECDSVPVAPVYVQRKNLDSNIPFVSTYEDQIVKVDFEPQFCVASVEVIEPEYIYVEENFFIDIIPSFTFIVNTNKPIFEKFDELNFIYSSDVDNPTISAKLTNPDGFSNKISLSDSYVLDQVGTYVLDVVVFKAGYKDQELTINIPVLQSKPQLMKSSKVVTKKALLESRSLNSSKNVGGGSFLTSDFFQSNSFLVLIAIAFVSLIGFAFFRKK